MKTIFFLLDVVETPWLQANKRNIVILSIISFVAIVTLVGFFIYRKKSKIKNNV